MVARGLGRMYEHGKGKFMVYVPVAVARDSAFPLRTRSPVLITIRGGRVVLEPVRE